MKRSYIVYVVMLLVVSFARVLPHPVGCSPLIAASLFIYLTSEHKAYWLLGLPVFFMLTAQLQSGFWQGWWIQPLSMLLILIAVTGYKSKNTFSSVLLGASVSSLFFILTNTGSWLVHALPYPMTVQGWIEAMDMGIPYFRPQLFWDTLFTVTTFIPYQLASQRVTEKLRKSNSITIATH